MVSFRPGMMLPVPAPAGPSGILGAAWSSTAESSCRATRRPACRRIQLFKFTFPLIAPSIDLVVWRARGAPRAMLSPRFVPFPVIPRQHHLAPRPAAPGAHLGLGLRLHRRRLSATKWRRRGACSCLFFRARWPRGPACFCSLSLYPETPQPVHFCSLLLYPRAHSRRRVSACPETAQKVAFGRFWSTPAAPTEGVFWGISVHFGPLAPPAK